MSEMQIKDGGGKGNSVKVDTSLRMHTAAITRPERDAAVVHGHAYLFVSGFQTLTNTTETAVLYVKNSNGSDLVIANIYCSFGTSTGGSGNMKFKVYTEVEDTSTIVTNASAARATNLQIGNTTDFTNGGTAYNGTTGEGVTGGNSIHTILPMAETVLSFDVPMHLPTSSNMAFTVTPPAGNTSMGIMLAVTGYYLDTALPE